MNRGRRRVMLREMLAARRVVRPLAAATIAAVVAAAAAGACNRQPRTARLDPAGTPKDDGSGLLAKASVKFTTGSEEGAFVPTPADSPPTAYGYDYGGGFGYGGFAYGGYGYGGSIYASFTPYLPYGPTVRTPDYSTSFTGADAGSIEGRVTWPRPPRVPATLAAPATCGGGTVANPSVHVGRGGAVEGAVVYLEKIASGRVTASPYGSYGKPITTGGTVELRGCALAPRVQVQLPLPAQLLVANGTDAPVTIAVARHGDAAATPLEQRLDAGGSRTLGVDAAGVLRVGDAAGALAPAWVIAASHPYYALTDDRGAFRLDEVVPGEYTLVVWHPPVVTGVVDGVVQHGEPVVVRKKVTVKKTAATRVELALP